MADRHYFGSGGGGGMSTGASGPRDRDSSRRNEPPKEVFKLNEPVKEVEEGYRPRYFPNAQPDVRLLPTPNFTSPNELTRSVHKHVRMAQWSCDGNRVATGGEYKELLVWSTQGAKLPFDPITIPPKQNPHSGHVGALAWSPVDPNILVSGDKGAASGSTVAVWNVSTFNPAASNTLAPLVTFKIPGDALHITFHPSGRQFAVVCPMRSRDEVYFYHFVPSPEPGAAEGAGEWVRRDDIALGGVSADHGSEEINSLRFTNSGELVCAVSNDGSLNAWVYPVDVEVPAAAAVAAVVNGTANGNGASGSSTPKMTQEDATREGTPEVGAATRDGEAAEQTGDVEMADGEAEAVAAGTTDAEGETATGEQAETKAEAETETPTPAVIDGDVEMASTHPSSVPGTSAPSRQPTPPPCSTAPAPVSTVPAPTPASASAKPRAKQLTRYRHSVCHSASLLSLAFDPRGQFLVVGGQDALLSLFDTRDWICERNFDVCSAAIRQSAISSDGEYIAVGGDDLSIVIVSAHTGSTVAKIDVRGMVYALSWHPKKNWLVYCTGPSKTDTKPAWYLVRQVGV
ncbi:hypothetical protein IAT38_006314 [Cryptococcus sp. DSM 104549]